MYYSAIGILALLVLLIENRDIFLNKNGAFSRPDWVAYKRFLLAVLAYYVTDILWGVLKSLKLERLLFFDTSLYFITMAVGVFCWTKYLFTYLNKTNLPARILLYSGYAFAGGITLLVVVNCFVPVLFSIGASCAYQALGGRYAVLGGQIFLLLLISVFAFFVLLRRKTQNRQKYRMLAFFSLIMAAFLAAQFWFPLLPLYAIAYLLGTCLLHTFVVGEEKENYRRELEEATKISTLRHSLATLLNNMPAMSYSKDAQTGVYIACNQAFTDYVQKSSPAEVIGLTDEELFETQTATQFLDYDRIALEADKPVTYFETATDVNGNTHQFQTTKLKYYNEVGTLCVLGMSLDMTEMERIKAENAQTLAAYREMVQESTVQENMIAAISQDYFNLFYVNIETEEYLEFGSRTKEGNRTVQTTGAGFFRTIKENAMRLVFEEDLQALVETLTKENLLQKLSQNDVYKYYYRLMIEGVPTYVSMKITRIPGDDKHLVIGITNVNEEMQTRMAAEQAKEEIRAYTRLSAFSRSLLVLYVIDPDTGEYTEFSSTEDYAQFGIAKKGADFFADTDKNARSAVYDEDQEHFFSMFTKENISRSIALDGIFVLDYRLMIDGKPTYIRLKASEVEEDEQRLLVVGIENVDRYVRREQQQAYDLSVAREQAMRDALTGVKNHLSFATEKQHLKEQEEKDFAIVVCDINNLKNVNDTQGHQAGDAFIRTACSTICNVFRHSPVFRIGGDEFAVICRGHDYDAMPALLAQMDAFNEGDADSVQIAYGMAKGEEGADVEAVFETADQRMYEHKAVLKHLPDAGTQKDETIASEIYTFPETLKKAYESSPLSFVYYQRIHDRAVPILASGGFCRNTGMPRESVLEWLENGMFERMHPDDVGVMSKISDDFLHQRGPYDIVFRCRIGPNTDTQKLPYVRIHGVGKWQTMPNGVHLAVITYANLDQTQKAMIEELQTYTLLDTDRFYTDPLTKLPNLNYLHEFGSEKINIVRAEGKIPHLVYVDIYAMQSYNNQYGVEEGDRLLCLTAETLSERFPRALITRTTDDHFVLITHLDDSAELERRLSETNKTIRKNAAGNTSGIRAGVCPIQENITLIEGLDCAKQALKSIENNLNKEVAFFSKEANRQFLHERYILENIDRAIEDGWIQLYYHALHRVESRKIAAFECLARWVDPVRGVLQPSEFIPPLIKYHQLDKLDLCMFEQACREVKLRYDNGLPLVPVSVNFSRQDFDHIDIVSEMNRIYDKYALDDYVDKSYLIVEITEQDLALGTEGLREQIGKIRENKYRLWLDDFGSGYSSINLFSQFDFDLIKYDRDFLLYLDDNGGANRVILQELIYLAHKLGIHTLIEGVETEEQLAFVKEIGCELAQGYYYHKPESLEQILTRVKNSGVIALCETPEERELFSKKWFE